LFVGEILAVKVQLAKYQQLLAFDGNSGKSSGQDSMRSFTRMFTGQLLDSEEHYLMLSYEGNALASAVANLGQGTGWHHYNAGDEIAPKITFPG
jgi:hypothetical protein